MRSRSRSSGSSNSTASHDAAVEAAWSQQQQRPAVRRSGRTGKNSMNLKKDRWCKPPQNYLKLNCDGSFMPHSGSGSWGFIIRNCEGDVVTSGRGKISHVLNAFQAELIACLQGLQIAVDMGIGRIIVETDATMVVQALSTED